MEFQSLKLKVRLLWFLKKIIFCYRIGIYPGLSFNILQTKGALCFLIFYMCTSCSPVERLPTAREGILDLKKIGLERGNIVKLDGEWEFYWKKFIEPCRSNSCTKPEQFIDSPKAWNGTKIYHSDTNSEVLSGEGYGTYRLLVQFQKDSEVALKVPNFGTAFHFFCNGEKKLSVGTVGVDLSTSHPVRVGSQIIFCKTIQSEIEFLVHISNFHNRKGGLWLSIFLGSVDSILDLRDSTLGLDLFLTGIVFIMGVYHLAIFSLRRTERSALYFGIFCLIISLRIVITNENYLYELLPNLNYNWGVSLEFLTIYVSIPIFGFFLRTLFKLDNKNKIHSFFLYISIFLSFVVIITPPSIFTYTLPIVQLVIVLYIFYILYILICSIQKKLKGSKIFLIGFLIFATAIINDILHTNYIINTGFYFPIGLVGFIFCQAFILADRFSTAFKKIEDLTHNLEIKISERTSELKEAKILAETTLEALSKSQAQVIQTEKLSALGILVSNISHEINTPIGAIGAGADNLFLSAQEILNSLHFIKNLSNIEILEIFKIIQIAQENRTSFSSKEERAIRKKLKSDLDLLKIPNSELLSGLFVELKIREINQEYIDLWNHPESIKIIELIRNLYGLFEKSISIKNSVKKTAKITTSLKTLSDDANFGSMKSTNISEGIDTVLLIYSNYINQGIEVVRNFDTVPEIYCNPESITQVWTNLIFNAIQALKNVKKLVINVKQVNNLNKEWVLVTIEDSGSGIPKDVLPKIFEPFFTTKKSGEGSGLGLYVSKQIIEKHGGSISVESSTNGTKFFIYLPIL